MEWFFWAVLAGWAAVPFGAYRLFRSIPKNDDGEGGRR